MVSSGWLVVDDIVNGGDGGDGGDDDRPGI